jgi:hypothetical protein
VLRLRPAPAGRGAPATRRRKTPATRAGRS